MPVKTTIPYSEGVFSITFTCVNWLPLIERTNGYDSVYNWFDYLKLNGHFILGYVIMPNHLHAVIAFRKARQSINTIIGNGKRFMAYEIIKRLKESNDTEILTVISNSVESVRKRCKKQHDVWELSFDWKRCENEKFVYQKLDYIHNNPCKGKWNLCSSPGDYVHSSARYYLTGEHGDYEVTGYAELMDIDLTKEL